MLLQLYSISVFGKESSEFQFLSLNIQWNHFGIYSYKPFNTLFNIENNLFTGNNRQYCLSTLNTVTHKSMHKNNKKTENVGINLLKATWLPDFFNYIYINTIWSKLMIIIFVVLEYIWNVKYCTKKMTFSIHWKMYKCLNKISGNK